MENKKRNIIITEEQIKEQIKIVGEKITNDYKDKPIYVLSLLRGSFIFTADLVRAIDGKTQIGFMTTSSYGDAEESTGTVKVVNDIPDNIEGLDVLIVDDIMDTGITMDFVIEHVKKLGAKSVKTCTLLDKPDRRVRDVHVDYVGFNIPDEFVVGFGLDYAQKYRNLPYIGSVEM